MELQVAISELLYLHDCVIIPGFGGFVTRYQPATIHPTQHSFTAPGKAILFNKSLNADDGLLANHISRNTGLSFSEAKSFIDKEVRAIDAALRQGKKVQLANVGDLYLDVEKSIQFSPDRSANYLLESFGLSEFQSAPIKRMEDYPRVVAMPSAVNVVKKDRKFLKRVLIAAALIPFAVGLSYLPFQTNINKQLSALIPFGSNDGKKGVYSPRNHDVKEINLKQVAFNYEKSVPVESAPAPVSQPEVVAVPKVEVKSQPVTVNTTVSYKFLLIAGCFESEANAQKFIADLNSKGLNAELAGKAPNGLIRVACGKFSDRNEAISAQRDLNQKNTATWIYAN
jgi:cell division protein FtsN